jgi:hypothetical protein
MNMKKERNTFLLICSLLLIAACLFSLYTGVVGINDVMAIKDYKTQQKDEGLASIKQLTDGVNQLKENEQTYVTGVGTYTAGLASYNAGAAKLAAAAKQLAAGEASYAAGQQKLAAGQAQYDAGKATLDSNTTAYNEGKAKLALVTPIYNVAKATGIDPLGIISQVEDGQAQIKEYEDGQQTLAQGAKSIADGQAALAQGKQTLIKGYSDYNAGVDALNKGAAQLASGKAQLSVYEDGEDQVAAGLDTLIAQKAIMSHDGKTVVVESIASRLGDNFSYWALNDDGTVKQVNGHNFLDLDACLKAAQAGTDYINDQGDTVTPELTGRVFLYMASFVVCLMGAITGIVGADASFAHRRLEKATFLGFLTAILAVGANVYGYIGGYTGYTYPLEDGTYSGTLQFIALITLAAMAIIFALVASGAFSAYKRGLADGTITEDVPVIPAEAEAAPEAPSVEADAADTVIEDGAADAGDTVTIDTEDTAVESAPAEAPAKANSDKLHKLEREEAELKQMLASLTSKINDIKQQEV